MKCLQQTITISQLPTKMQAMIIREIPCHQVFANRSTQYHLWSILVKSFSPKSYQISRSNNQFIGNQGDKETWSDIIGCNQQNFECRKLCKTNDLVSSTEEQQITKKKINL